MKAQILDDFTEPHATCYLSKIDLKEYISSLPDDYKEYEVQREIVNNAYLDALITTITEGRHIPPIVLVVEQDDFSIENRTLNIQKFKILDGLQRTFRLKAIYDSIILLDKKIPSNPAILHFSKLQLAKNFKNEIETLNSSSIIISKLLEFYREHPNKSLETLYKRAQWFEIWTDLKPDDEVNKMLILNAGHKAVKTKHQLELLFRNILPILQKVDLPKFRVIREKDTAQYKLGKERKPGQFLFSNLITALLSFSESKPLTTNIDLIQKSQNAQFGDDVFDELLKLDFLQIFLRSLIILDENLFKTFGTIGTQWLGRETSLVGVYAAIGKYSKDHQFGDSAQTDHLIPI